MTPEITVQTTIQKDIASVWKLWTTPVDIAQWNNPSKDWHSPRVEVDLRTGGRFFFRMEAKDGSAGFDHCGKYDQVITHELIEYTGDDGRKSSILFESAGNVTTIVETFEPEPVTPVYLQNEFCQAILESFKNYAESENNKMPGTGV